MLRHVRAYIGSTLYIVFAIVYTPLHAVVLCGLAPFVSLTTRWNMAVAWNTIMIKVLRVLCGVKWNVSGLENVPHGGAIIAAKHQSTWETFAIPMLMRPRRLCLVYKKELVYVPFFGWAIASLKMVPINRKKGQESFNQVVEIGGQRMKEGAMMMFFPEGTRIAPGKYKKYKTGSARLAIATDTPILPVAHDAGEFWRKNSFLKYPGTVTIHFGPLIHPQGHTPDTMMQAVEDWIEGEMHRISPHRYANAAQ